MKAFTSDLPLVKLVSLFIEFLTLHRPRKKLSFYTLNKNPILEPKPIAKEVDGYCLEAALRHDMGLRSPRYISYNVLATKELLL